VRRACPIRAQRRLLCTLPNLSLKTKRLCETSARRAPRLRYVGASSSRKCASRVILQYTLEPVVLSRLASLLLHKGRRRHARYTLFSRGHLLAATYTPRPVLRLSTVCKNSGLNNTTHNRNRPHACLNTTAISNEIFFENSGVFREISKDKETREFQTHMCSG